MFKIVLIDSFSFEALVHLKIDFPRFAILFRENETQLPVVIKVVIEWLASTFGLIKVIERYLYPLWNMPIWKITLAVMSLHGLN